MAVRAALESAVQVGRGNEGNRQAEMAKPTKCRDSLQTDCQRLSALGSVQEALWPARPREVAAGRFAKPHQRLDTCELKSWRALRATRAAQWVRPHRYQLRSDAALMACAVSKRTATLRSSGMSSPNLDHTATRSLLFGTTTRLGDPSRIGTAVRTVGHAA
jgi:hypothetical protein